MWKALACPPPGCISGSCAGIPSPNTANGYMGTYILYPCAGIFHQSSSTCPLSEAISLSLWPAFPAGLSWTSSAIKVRECSDLPGHRHLCAGEILFTPRSWRLRGHYRCAVYLVNVLKSTTGPFCIAGVPLAMTGIATGIISIALTPTSLSRRSSAVFGL